MENPSQLEQTPPAARPVPMEVNRDALLAAPSIHSITPELSLVIPTLNEEANLPEVLARARALMQRLGLRYEILVADGGSSDATCEIADGSGARTLRETLGRGRHYGEALCDGLRQASGEYIVTMDCDLSHAPEFIEQLWNSRNDADVVIASRYVRGGASDASSFRHSLSVILNFGFTRMFRLPLHDVSSGYRLYRRNALEELKLRSRDFDVLEEIVVAALDAGKTAKEIPFHYRVRRAGHSHARLVRCGRAYLATMWRLLRRETKC